MTLDRTTPYNTIAAAEAAIIEAGYKRDVQRAMWTRGLGEAVKVIRGRDGKFYISA